MIYQGLKLAKRQSNREKKDQNVPQNGEMRENSLLEAVMGRVGCEHGAVRLFLRVLLGPKKTQNSSKKGTPQGTVIKQRNFEDFFFHLNGFWGILGTENGHKNRKSKTPK